MSERDLRERLRDAAAPDQDARERAWRVVRAAHAAHDPEPRRRALRRPALAAAAVVAVLVVAATTSVPTDAVARWVQRVLRAGEPHPHPALVSVPGGGRLLVVARPGVWVVAPDGAKRRIGRYAGATWSPHGLFVLAWQGGALTALAPNGGVRWSLARPAPIRSAAWSPVDGFRIAYVTGAQLRVVNGDGTGDRRQGAALAGVQPAWRAGGDHVLAYADRGGRVTVVAVDARHERWRSAPIAGLRMLAWAPGGTRLLALAADRLIVFDAAGKVLREHPVAAGAEAVDAAWRPDGRRIVLSLYDPRRGRSDVVLLTAAAAARGRLLFSGPGRFGRAAWSPGGERLLVPWPQADQWLFLRAGARSRVSAVANIAAQFDPGSGHAAAPAIAGWCC